MVKTSTRYVFAGIFKQENETRFKDWLGRVYETYKSQHQTGSDENGADDRHDPMHSRISSPSIPEQADWYGDGSGDHERETMLWFQIALSDMLLYDLISEVGGHELCCE